MRRATRRSAQVSHFRRERVVVEAPSEGSPSEEANDDGDGVEKIEVHVHLHRGEADAAGGRRKRPTRRPMLTGVLFDWQGHYDRILSQRPPGMKPKRWSRLAKCPSCQATVPSAARRCPRCAAPRSPRLLSKFVALIGLGSLVAVFAICARLLGGSVSEAKPPGPLGQWSDDDAYVIVEVPVAPSPFAYTPPSAAGTASSEGSSTTR